MHEVTHDLGIDLYELLEVSPQASSAVIRAAYHTLARAWHTDVNPSHEAGQRMRDINAAYGVLGEPRRRAAYDLERTRLRRRERTYRTVPRVEITPVTGFDRGATRQLPRTASLRVPTRGLPTQVLLGVLIIAAIVAATMILAWAGPLADDTRYETTQIVELHGSD